MPPTLLTILTLAVPSRHASNAAYHPYTRSALPTCFQCRLPSLCSQCAPNMPPMPPSHLPNPQCRLSSLCSCIPLKMRLQRCPPSLPIPMLPWHPQDMPLKPPSTGPYA
ncbi:hypothetical protein O181_129646 [Austropuccinia psidii MF-1]|uniref:Uncharacterized protein n=1 Tax=Austropuccinia psidii MF-1 TaxID=1389203 RepID=A0A9Q3L181_9BASI|nr:hypothetical protein [Austropuccinia psidii MF-1]